MRNESLIRFTSAKRIAHALNDCKTHGARVAQVIKLVKVVLRVLRVLLVSVASSESYGDESTAAMIAGNRDDRG